MPDPDANSIWSDGPSVNPDQPRKVEIRNWGTWVETQIDSVPSIYATKEELAEAEIAGATFVTNEIDVTGGGVIDVPYDDGARRVAAPSIDSGQALVGGATVDFGVYAPSGVRGDANDDDPDAEVSGDDLIVSKGGNQRTLSGDVFAFRSVRINGRCIVARRLGLPWPHDRARVEGIYGGPLYPMDDAVVLGISGNGQSTMAATKGFEDGTFTVPTEYAAPADYPRITMMARYSTSTDERGSYNRLNNSGYVPWTAAHFRGVDDYFGKGGPGSVHGVSPMLTLTRGLTEAMLSEIGRAPFVHIHNVSLGGAPLLMLGPSPGTSGNVNNTNNPRNDDMIAVQLAYDHWASRGKAYHVAVSYWSQGEANDTAGDGSAWAGQWQNTVMPDRVSGYAAITGQPNPPIFLHHQISTCRDESIGRGFNSTLGQWIEHQAGRLVLVGPDYACRAHDGYADDNQHFNVVGYGHRGDYAHRALRYIWRDGTYDPLHVSAVDWNGTTGVTLTLDGTDASDIAVDTVLMSNPGQYGFRVFDEGAASAEITVSSVSRTGVMTLGMVLGSTPVGPLRIDCGLTGYTSDFGTTNPDGFVASEQMRTCIRSTNSFTGYDGLTLYHWLIHQRITGVTA